MIGKADEIQIKRITRSPLFSFDVKDHMSHKDINQLVQQWLREYPHYEIQSITFYAIDRTEVAIIVYKV